MRATSADSVPAGAMMPNHTPESGTGRLNSGVRHRTGRMARFVPRTGNTALGYDRVEWFAARQLSGYEPAEADVRSPSARARRASRDLWRWIPSRRSRG